MDKQQAKVSELGVPLRKRVAKACDQCRRRKTKCDGQPHCNTCNSVGLKCSYGDPTKQMRGPTYVLHLERRVDELEGHLTSSHFPSSMLDEELWQAPYGGYTYTTTSSTTNNAMEQCNSACQWPYIAPWTPPHSNSQVPQDAKGSSSWPVICSAPSSFAAPYGPTTFPTMSVDGTTTDSNSSLQGPL